MWRPLVYCLFMIVTSNGPSGCRKYQYELCMFLIQFAIHHVAALVVLSVHDRQAKWPIRLQSSQGRWFWQTLIKMHSTVMPVVP